MTTEAYQGIALIAMVIAMPLLSWGTWSGLPLVAAAGGALLVLGAASLTVLRYIHPKEDE